MLDLEPDPARCLIYAGTSWASFFISALFAVSIFLSFVPQQVRIYRRRTTEGISPLFIMLGTMSGFSALLNTVMLTQTLRECCSALSWLECSNTQFGLIQVALQSLAAVIILLLCVHCTDDPIEPVGLATVTLGQVYQACKGHAAVSGALVIYTLLWAPQWVPAVANTFGLLATVLSSIQYIPQISTTWQLKHAGSLSIKLMLIQTPGGFLWAITMMLRPGTLWSTWMPSIAAACLQGVLLCMCIGFALSPAHGEPRRDAREAEPLLA